MHTLPKKSFTEQNVKPYNLHMYNGKDYVCVNISDEYIPSVDCLYTHYKKIRYPIVGNMYTLRN